MKARFESLLSQCPLVAILRGITPDEILPACETLGEAGIRLLEIPLNSPDAFRSIALASAYCEEHGMMAGAGTVTTPEGVQSVATANGRFIISPNTNPEVIRATKRLGLLSIPGFFTASEAFEAMAAGADYLKLFPAILGPGYVKDLKAVVKAPIMAVGGVNAENLAGFLKVCCGVGIGSALYKAGKSLEAMRADAEAMIRAAKA